jgi:hypothetical protein
MFRKVLALCILTGIGLGSFSCIFFLWNWLIGPPQSGVLWSAIIGYAALAVVLFRTILKRETSDRRRHSRLPAALFVLLCGYAGSLLAIKYIKYPYGLSDAWSIWNLHARLLYRGGEQWLQMFSPDLYWSLPDYPLLLPSLVAGGWRLAGMETTAVGGFIGALFTFAVIALLVSSVSLLSNDFRGLAAGLVLLATPDFILSGSYQQADIPLSFFILLTAVLFYLNDKLERQKLFLVLAGMSAGFAAWTKNEGLLFVVCVLAARLLVGAATRPLALVGRETQVFCYGLVPILSVVMVFKLFLSPPNNIFSDLHRFAGRLTDASRYLEVARYFTHGIAAFGSGWVHPLSAVAIYLVYVWPRRLGRSDATQVSTLLLLTFMISGYFMTYMLTPYDLQWHLTTSFNRLLLHLWPTFVFCAACTGINLKEGINAD